MKTARIIAGLLCVIAAAVPSYLLYAKHEDGNMRNPGLFLMMLIASVISFAIFSLAKKLPSLITQLIAGIFGSYIAIFGLFFLLAAIKGTEAEFIMWSPIIIIFGIPWLAPLVAMSWLSSILVFGINKKII